MLKNTGKYSLPFLVKEAISPRTACRANPVFQANKVLRNAGKHPEMKGVTSMMTIVASIHYFENMYLTDVTNESVHILNEDTCAWVGQARMIYRETTLVVLATATRYTLLDEREAIALQQWFGSTYQPQGEP